MNVMISAPSPDLDFAPDGASSLRDRDTDRDYYLSTSWVPATSDICWSEENIQIARWYHGHVFYLQTKQINTSPRLLNQREIIVNLICTTREFDTKANILGGFVETKVGQVPG